MGSPGDCLAVGPGVQCRPQGRRRRRGFAASRGYLRGGRDLPSVGSNWFESGPFFRLARSKCRRCRNWARLRATYTTTAMTTTRVPVDASWRLPERLPGPGPGRQRPEAGRAERRRLEQRVPVRHEPRLGELRRQGLSLRHPPQEHRDRRGLGAKPVAGDALPVDPLGVEERGRLHGRALGLLPELRRRAGGQPQRVVDLLPVEAEEREGALDPVGPLTASLCPSGRVGGAAHSRPSASRTWPAIVERSGWTSSRASTRS
jgi:hypothetical protein